MCKWTMWFHEITEAVIPVLVTLRELIILNSTQFASQPWVSGSSGQPLRELLNIQYLDPTLRKAEIVLNGDKAFVFH